MKTILDLLEDTKYMPMEFRDFHDQKDLFKLLFSKIKMPNEVDNISWVQAHIFTVDVFLWFMAKRGYTLQKSRHKLDFIDIQKEISEMHDKQLEILNRLIPNNN